MPNLIASKQVTARKDHRCFCCTAVAVAKGQTYTRETYVYDGRVYTLTVCPDCQQLTGTVFRWASSPEEGVGPDDYQEWAYEHRDDPERGEAARAWLNRAGVEPA